MQSDKNYPWWKETTVYQIYPRSFQDSNGDGIGDLPGIISRLDYLQQTGFETIWISPFFPSPQRDLGYDISDYYSVDPQYGSMEDFYSLVEEVHRRDMKLVMDMVLNHTSDQHPWFIESASSRSNPKRDWYVWRDGKKSRGRRPPNNWHSMVSGNGWHYHSQTKQWYWASFLDFQPDLNYRNPEVKEEMFNMLRFWLDKGVDGFRLDIIGAVYEDPEFRDNPLTLRLLPNEDNEGYLFRSTKMTQNHPDNFKFARELRRIIDEYSDPPRFLVGETFGSPEVVRQFCGSTEGCAEEGAEGGGATEANAGVQAGTAGLGAEAGGATESNAGVEAGGGEADRRGSVPDGLNLAFLFQTMHTPFTAPAMRSLIGRFETVFSEPLIPTYVFSNHDRTRRFSQLGGDLRKAKLNTVLQFTVRGVPFTYYGEEIGMRQGDIEPAESQDAVARHIGTKPAWKLKLLNKITGGAVQRDGCRTPMQWDSGAQAGFTSPDASPWMPVNSDAAEVNLAAQKDDPASLYRLYRDLLKLRREHPALHRGSQSLLPADALPKSVLGYRRIAEAVAGERVGAEEELLVLLNFSASTSPSFTLPGQYEPLFSTSGPLNGGGPMERIALAAYEGRILRKIEAREESL